jgi:cell division protein FtsQ
VERAASIGADSSRRNFLRRRKSNRRVVIQRKPLLLVLADLCAGVGRIAWRVVKLVGTILVAGALVAGLFFGGRWAIRHVIDSPRFALQRILIAPTTRITEAEIRALVDVAEGDRLLALDTDAIANALAQHPWALQVRVRRQLPSSLSIDVVERRAAAVVALGGLYLVDEAGRPFKRATMEEADGLPVVTGLDRAQYVAARAAAEAAVREALALVALYGAAAGRPPLSEVNLHPRHGHTLYLLEGGAEIRLGFGDFDKKLARLDRIFEALRAKGAEGIAAVRVVHLDGGLRDRIPVRLAERAPEDEAPPVTAAAPTGGKQASKKN